MKYDYNFIFGLMHEINAVDNEDEDERMNRNRGKTIYEDVGSLQSNKSGQRYSGFPIIVAIWPNNPKIT